MKLPYLPVLLAALFAVLFLGACSVQTKVDPNVGLPTGAPEVMGRHGEAAETQIMTEQVMALAGQYPRRPAFETAVMQQIRTGELKATKLTVLYADGAVKVFK